MLELVDFPTPPGLRSLSPFGYKAEALLALGDMDYTKIPPAPGLMPHDKIPVLREDGRLIPDSSLIQRHLEDSGRLTCDSGLTLQERAVAEAFRRMAEEHLRWVLAYTRWMEPACEAVMSRPRLRPSGRAGPARDVPCRTRPGEGHASRTGD